jgi:hypothetical protein
MLALHTRGWRVSRTGGGLSRATGRILGLCRSRCSHRGGELNYRTSRTQLPHRAPGRMLKPVFSELSSKRQPNCVIRLPRCCTRLRPFMSTATAFPAHIASERRGIAYLPFEGIIYALRGGCAVEGQHGRSRHCIREIPRKRGGCRALVGVESGAR